MNKEVKVQTSVIFPSIVSQTEFGDIPENNYLFDLVSKMKSNKNISNKCEVADTTTFSGYQPDIMLHEYLKDDPVWKSFLNKVFVPTLNQHMNAHRQIAGFPVPGSSFKVNSSWAVIYPEKAYQAPHFHRDMACVFTYYVRVPKSRPPQNAITFINPNLASTYPTQKSFPYDHSIIPITGTNLIFPANIQHFAHPHFGEGEKMIIVFDITFEPPKDYISPKRF
ncbi:MAG: hypothetical protein COA86_15350 [Kangiella sp.]|nr:MAG: hypothetical protein COA86_15350 [Kangiella sp.]